MVIPVDRHPGGQDLLLIEKSADGSIRKRAVIPVRFVPLTGPGVGAAPAAGSATNAGPKPQEK